MTNNSIITIAVIIIVPLLIWGALSLKPAEPTLNGDITLTPTTNLEKFEYSVRSEELLRLQHNEMGAKFRKGEISEKEWNAYLKEFDPKSKKLGHDKSILRDSIVIESPNKDISSSTPKEDIKPEPKSIYELQEEFKSSTKYQIDLTKI